MGASARRRRSRPRRARSHRGRQEVRGARGSAEHERRRRRRRREIRRSARRSHPDGGGPACGRRGLQRDRRLPRQDAHQERVPAAVERPHDVVATLHDVAGGVRAAAVLRRGHAAALSRRSGDLPDRPSARHLRLERSWPVVHRSGRAPRIALRMGHDRLPGAGVRHEPRRRARVVRRAGTGAATAAACRRAACRRDGARGRHVAGDAVAVQHRSQLRRHRRP